MKILHIAQMIGGLDVYIRNTIMYANNDFEYVIVHGEGDKSAPIEKNGVTIKEYLIPLYRELSIINDIKSVVQTIRIIKKERPDVIHCHSAKGGVVGRITGFLTRTKTFYTPHAFSYLSSESKIKRVFYKTVEKFTRFKSYLLACSESEKQLGINEVHYKNNHAFAWNNAVPDANLLLNE